MNLSLIDWLIIGGVFALVIGSAIYTRRYTRSVADFLSANRCAGRYLLTVAQGMAGFGAVTIVAWWEQFYQGGFGAIHWGMMLLPIGLVLALSGWVIYRYRQTRALTLPQFLELRYSRRFRVFAGVMCFTSGVLNYGIFPAVTGRFLIYFMDLPVVATSVPGLGIELNWTLGLVMALLLSAALAVTLNGGQIAVMVSDFVQGQVSNIGFLVLLGALLWLVPWPDLIATLKTAPTGASKLNPFDQGELPDFSPMFFVMMLVLQVYTYRVWQGSQGYNASARSPHEAKMATVLAEFRGMITFLLVPLAAIVAWAVLNGEVRPDEAAMAQATLDRFQAAGDEQLANQITTSVTMRELLPGGVLGLLTAVMIMAAVSTDSTYLHSWGSIFVQDVLSPIRQLRGKPRLSPEAHLRWLKRAIFGVAVFGWVFSMLFPVQEYILMYMMATGAIFTGGAGAVLIGGLYWRRGTTGAAWAAMVVGSALSVTGVLTINLLWPWLVGVLQGNYADKAWVRNLPEKFWLNGVQMGFTVSLIAIATYVIVSLLSKRSEVDFDQMFHRGRYAVEPKEGEPDYVPKTGRDAVPRWLRKLGVTEEFTTGDKVIFGLKYLFFFWQFGIGFLGLSIAYAVFGLMRSDDSWANWWTIYLWVTVAAGTTTTVWFLVGGIRDLFKLFGQLKQIRRDAEDDGTVTQHFGRPQDDAPTASEPSADN